ncbi:MAG: RHS repeat-associated core domain-containing protein [Chthonomonadetes bacterium]|nr:RHS repeat-associated core domain-containing protein [Chthonomonadetes bacterium]
MENHLVAYGNVLTAGYNGDGLRVWKQTAGGRRYFLYDGEELVCELDASGNVVAGIVHGANGLLVYGSAGYQFDPQGNSTHLLNDNGYAVSHLAYDAWGELKWGSNPTPYGYKGQWGYYRDMETGLLLLTHRYLDPASGRFLTRDPEETETDANLYAYLANQVVAPPKPGQDEREGDEEIEPLPKPPKPTPKPGFGSWPARCICILGLLLCAKPTAPPESDELYPGPEPPCSDYEGKGYKYTSFGQALSACLRHGEKPRRKNRTDITPACKGGKGDHGTYWVGRYVVTVLCCPCSTNKGVTAKRCKCERKPRR